MAYKSEIQMKNIAVVSESIIAFKNFVWGIYESLPPNKGIEYVGNRFFIIELTTEKRKYTPVLDIDHCRGVIFDEVIKTDGWYLLHGSDRILKMAESRIIASKL